MVKSLQSHKIWFLFDNIGICWYNKLVIVRLYTTNKKRAQGENLDFLSFLTQAADYLVGFAKTFAGLSVALIIFMLARCLPKRIRRYFSACATLVITFALFRDSVQQFTFFTIKASVVNFTIAYLTALTFLFFRLRCHLYCRRGRRSLFRQRSSKRQMRFALRKRICAP